MANFIEGTLPSVSGIYQIVNKITQKRYVGYATNIRTRINGHLYDLRRNKHANDYLQKAWNKYGEKLFSFIVLQECEKEKLCFYEDYWVKVLKTTDSEFGYNLKDTDPFGHPEMSEKTKEKIRIANKGKRPSDLCFERRKEIPMTEAHKNACREGLKKVDWITLRKNKRKKVLDINTGEVFDSLRIASESVGIHKSKLSKYLLGTRSNKTNLKYL